MKPITMISDGFFHDSNQSIGGAEMVDKTIADYLNITSFVKSDSLKQIPEDHNIILTNFYNISDNIKSQIINGPNQFIIIEHDYKFFPTRNPWDYPNSICPEQDKRFLDLYDKASCVFLQTEDQANCFKANNIEAYIRNFDCSIWSSEEIQFLNNVNKGVGSRLTHFAVIDSFNPIKGTKEAIDLCIKNKWDYDLIHKVDWRSLMKNLSLYTTLVFMPQAKESLCRLVVEARALELNVITPITYGASTSHWFKLNGENLTNYLNNRSNINLTEIKKILSEI